MPAEPLPNELMKALMPPEQYAAWQRQQASSREFWRTLNGPAQRPLGSNAWCVKDATGRALALVYSRDDLQSAAFEYLTSDEARRIATNCPAAGLDRCDKSGISRSLALT